MVDQVSEYRLIESAGEGILGPTHVAEHIRFGRKVLVHLMDEDAAPPPSAVEAFRYESSAAAQSGVVGALAVLEAVRLDDGRLSVAQALPSGRRLSELLRAGALPVGRAIAITRQIARILSACHDAGVLHGALGPRSVWIDDSDEVEVADFGFATLRQLSPKDGSSAPEARDGEPFDQRADVFGLGGLLFATLTGEVPRDSTALAQHPDLLPAMRAVIDRALADSPADRFTDVRDFEASLLEAQLAVGIGSPADKRPLPSVAPERRARLEAAFPEAGAPAPEPGPAPGRQSPWLAIVGVVAIGVGAVAVVTLSDDSRTPELAVAATGEPEPPNEAAAQIEDLSRAARAAAARQRYVYPPVGQMDAPTAHSVVLELEAIGTGAARERGAELRAEFAGSLRKVADVYYGLQPESSVTAGLYLEVLAFTPEDPIALEQSKTSLTEIEEFRRTVAERKFTTEQLVDAQALAIVKERDPDARSRLLAEHRTRTAGTNGERTRNLEALVQLPFPWDESHLIGGAPEDEPSNEPTDDLLDDVPDESPEQKKARAFKIAQFGTAAFKSGRRDEAKRYLEGALELNPRLAYAHDALGTWYFDRSNFSMAATHAKKAVGISPNTAAFRTRYGDALYRLGRIKDALAQYEVAAKKGANVQRRIDRARSKL